MSRRRYTWVAEEYDAIERLDSLGLPPHRIGRLLDPPASPDAVRNACHRAGILLTAGRAGRPSAAQRAGWSRIEASIGMGRADA